MPMFLAGIGWIAEQPSGNRLRWTIDPEEVTPGAQFRGLPNVVTLQRAPLQGAAANTVFADSPTFPVPFSWWQVLGDIQASGMFPARVVLPKQVQAVRFTYAGSDAYFRAWDRAGSGRTLLQERVVQNGELVVVEAARIQEFEFFTLGATLQQVIALDLFADHAAGLPFETIARVSPRATVAMSFETAYQRYGALPTLENDEWTEFQETLIPQALASSPAAAAGQSNEPPPWQEVQLLLAARWEYAVVYGMGFLDGPDAGPATSADQIRNNLLQTMGSVSHVYRAIAEFADGSVERSNLIVIAPLPAFPLPVPTNLSYANPEVRLYGDDTYTVTSSLNWHTGSRQVVGVDIEEEAGASPIFGSEPEVMPLTFRSPNPSATYPAMTMGRRFDVPFYDVPLRFHARSIDGWDRASPFSPWTAQVVPAFIHNPVGPPLFDARFDGAQVVLRAQTEHLSFTEWLPDHAIVHTPGSMIEVLRRVEEPDHVTVTLGQPSFYAQELNRQVRLYSVPVPPLADPGKYVGGYLNSATCRAEILRLENGRYIFEPAADSMHGSALFDAGSATLQQAANHADLFTVVTQFPATNLPHVLEFSDALAAADGKTGIAHYALRVRIGALRGAIGNTVQALVVPQAPEAPPPFSVELLGIDFYDRTLVRISFLNNLASGKYTLFWAHGILDAASFDEAAIAGDLGAQQPHNHHDLYELFSLPIPRAQEAQVTFGAQCETNGAYKSAFTLVHAVVPAYAAEP